MLLLITSVIYLQKFTQNGSAVSEISWHKQADRQTKGFLIDILTLLTETLIYININKLGK